MYKSIINQMKKTDITNGLSYLEIPELDLRILCGCPENSIKFIMQKGLTPSIEINGFKLVSGPNAILLNDYTILNSHFLNFSEFPMLHHQYFQGASFNGSNEKLLLIGNEKKVNEQYYYIKRGLYGLDSKEEILNSGVDTLLADKFLAINKYHRGERKIHDLINKVFIKNKTNIKGDLYIERISINVFEFTYKNEKEIVDLNLSPKSKGVGLPYTIDHQLIKFTDFSITTVGDGNGWNPEVPCMGALITAKGKRYLVDSGPGSFDLIRKLGLTPSEVEGVFITHSHDDHFAGMLSLLNSDSRVKFFSSGIVIESVEKKFEALLGVNKTELKKYIDFIVLKEGIWTDIGDMEVKPMYSFHTIETNVFYFRSLNDKNEWKVYGHITDIISKKDLDRMIEGDSTGIINHSWADKWFNNYLETSDLKRIDAGGGVVHGSSNDFVNDKSRKIILSHLNHDINTSGISNFYSPTKFGYTEVLINTDKNYLLEKTIHILCELHLLNKESKKNISEDCISLFKPKDIISNSKEKIKFIYLVLSGLVESEDINGFKRKYVKGDFLYSFNNEKSHNVDYISTSYCYLYKIEIKKILRYLKNIKPNNEFRILRESPFFTYGYSFKKLLDLSLVSEAHRIKKGHVVNLTNFDNFIVIEGKIELSRNSKVLYIYSRGELSSYNDDGLNVYVAKANSSIIMFRQEDIQEFTSLLWSCYEASMKIETIVETSII